MTADPPHAGDLAILLPDLGGGGAERVYVIVANQFADWGLPVRFVLGRREGPFLDQLDPRIAVDALDAPSLRAAVPRLARYLRARPPGVLLCGVDLANLTGLMAQRLARVQVPVVISSHIHIESHLAQKGALTARLLRPALRMLYGAANARVAVSRGVAENLSSFLSIPADRIDVIYNPVDLARAGRMAEAPVPHPWLAESDIPVLVSIGRLVAQKDQAALLRAFARVAAVREARLILLGEGPDRATLEAEAAALGISEHILMPGFVENPFAYQAHAAAFVLSSRYEGFGNVLIEAMACGCAVVSTDCPSGPSEILEDGRIGPLAPVGDDAALADAILSALTAPIAPGVLRARAQDFSAERQSRRYLELLRRVGGTRLASWSVPEAV